MQTLILKIDDSVYDKFMWFLNHFSKEIEIEYSNKESVLDDFREIVKIIKNNSLDEYVISDDEFYKEFSK